MFHLLLWSPVRRVVSCFGCLQGKQAKEASKSQMSKDGHQMEKVATIFKVGTPDTHCTLVTDVTKTQDGYLPMSPRFSAPTTFRCECFLRDGNRTSI